MHRSLKLNEMKGMKKLGLLITFVGIALLVVAQGSFSRVKIDLNTEVTMQKLVELGLEADHGEVQKDKWFISDLSRNDIEVLRKYKIPHEIQIADVIKFYIERNQQALNNQASEATERSGSCKASPQGYKTPKGFSYGSMGGFFSYDEALNKLDSLSILYPDIVSARKPIGNYLTANGNAIHWLKISDNPTVDEAEPQILYDALHHAREPVSLSQLVYYMYFLCENYKTHCQS
jgi:carboxypeptidase T